MRQIEKDKENETTPTLDGKANTITVGEGMKVLQLKKDEKTGVESLQKLSLSLEDSSYYYFGVTKDAPLLLTEFEGGYQPKNFTGTSDSTILTAITPDIPVYLEVTTSSGAFDIVTTYTFRPTQSNKKFEPGIQVTLRLSQVTEKKTEKVIDHIVTSKVGTYTATLTPTGGASVTYGASAAEDKVGMVLRLRPAIKGGPAYDLGRYEGASPATLLRLTNLTDLGSSPIDNLVFEDNKLSITIPGEIEKIMLINFTLA